MIQDARLVSEGTQWHLPPAGGEQRRDKAYALTPFDLIKFAESPYRWAFAPQPEPDDPLPIKACLRARLLRDPGLPCPVVPAPETYKATERVCPKCASKGVGIKCAKCNTTRVARVLNKKWRSTAEYCVAFAAASAKRGQTVITGVPATATTGAHTALAADPHASYALAHARRLLHIQGTWLPKQGADPVPVAALVDAVTEPDSELGTSLLVLTPAADVSPDRWSRIAMQKGLHIQAAMQTLLLDAVLDQPVARTLWLTTETAPPHIVGRRRSTPAIDAAGRQACELLLQRYAFCRQNNLWPVFDANCSGELPSWTAQEKEDWDALGSTQGTHYWAFAGIKAAAA